MHLVGGGLNPRISLVGYLKNRATILLNFEV